MTFLWLFFWVVSNNPSLSLEGSGQQWLVALVICLVIDIGGGIKSFAKRLLDVREREAHARELEASRKP